mmetsp:Transcript_34296/g.78535  ORF Transcript_34296/g.78535 Transcript_34296/m.78535 type:complete len:230 (-) Transcript_34296:170-859(-)
MTGAARKFSTSVARPCSRDAATCRVFLEGPLASLRPWTATANSSHAATDVKFTKKYPKLVPRRKSTGRYRKSTHPTRPSWPRVASNSACLTLFATFLTIRVVVPASTTGDSKPILALSSASIANLGDTQQRLRSLAKDSASRVVCATSSTVQAASLLALDEDDEEGLSSAEVDSLLRRLLLLLTIVAASASSSTGAVDAPASVSRSAVCSQVSTVLAVWEQTPSLESSG